MRCTSPRTVGFMADGKTISWSPKKTSKEYASFKLPCGKCISCRLDYARQWAIRCTHEAQLYDHNAFITLTYDQDNIGDNVLNYLDFQLFIKRLRDHIRRDAIKRFGPINYNLLDKEQKEKFNDKIRIGFFATGEYGDKTKRKHWHACVFNWSPSDSLHKYTNDRGDKIYSSDTLTELWGKGLTEFGSVTFESAGYCARYAAKKLGHGRDQDHDFHPISKKSNKYAIGKRWLERYWTDVFNTGYVVLQNGETSAIPRYYEKWLKKHKPKEFEIYVNNIKSIKESLAASRSNIENIHMQEINEKRIEKNGFSVEFIPTKDQVRKVIQEQKFKMLQEKLKL